MQHTEPAGRLTVECDGSEYQLFRRPEVVGPPLPEAGLPVWVIQAHGHYIGTFPAAESETPQSVRDAACGVIRNGSTSFHPVSDHR